MRVLIVEDERKIATDLQLALTEAGYVMDLAFDGEEAWYLGDTEDYDAVMCGRHPWVKVFSTGQRAFCVRGASHVYDL